MSLDAAWNLVGAYVAANAEHVRKGYKLADLDPIDVLRYAGEEMLELCDAPEDQDEMVDLLGCLFHYAARRGWTPASLLEHLEGKLKLRFGVPAAVHAASVLSKVSSRGSFDELFAGKQCVVCSAPAVTQVFHASHNGRERVEHFYCKEHDRKATTFRTVGELSGAGRKEGETSHADVG